MIYDAMMAPVTPLQSKWCLSGQPRFDSLGDGDADKKSKSSRESRDFLSRACGGDGVGQRCTLSSLSTNCGLRRLSFGSLGSASALVGPG